MSVYKPPGSKHYRYDFQLRGRRFFGNTETASRREAEKVEELKREEAKAAIAKQSTTEVWSFDVAAGAYYTEKGAFLAGEGAENAFRAVAWLKEQIGTLPVSAIDDSEVARLVAIRRGNRVHGRKNGPLVSPATVNRSCTEMLRKILGHAKLHGQKVADINWGRHMLAEPQERIRELHDDEEARILKALREDYEPLFRFALASGLRLSECLLPRLTRNDFDWGNAQIRVRGKGGKIRLVPITTEIRDIVRPLLGRHDEAVFCYQVQRTRGTRTKGEWLPITKSGLKTMWRRLKVATGILDYRWHDNRHTTATRLLRQTGNLRQVQRLLGHTKIETTTKYAHSSIDDLRDGMEQVARGRRKPKGTRRTKNG